jgi:8-oxo-dGTP pyrophosphatase MutT (NUDIX family)
MLDFVEKIKLALENKLPGAEAQYKMAHLFRRQHFDTPENAKKAAVMLLLFPKENILHTVLIQRTSTNENDQHSGQVSFPGGKFEKTDLDYAYCAKRETFEEVGVPIENIGILGALTELYIPVSNFLVFPFVGFLEKEPQWKEQKSEVVEIMKIPISHFFQEDNKKNTTLKIKDFVMEDVPYYGVNGKIVWGATAMILSEFCDLI